MDIDYEVRELKRIRRARARKMPGRREHHQGIQQWRTRVIVRELEVRSGLTGTALWRRLHDLDYGRNWLKCGPRWVKGERNISPELAAEAAKVLKIELSTPTSDLWCLLEPRGFSDEALQEIASRCGPPAPYAYQFDLKEDFLGRLAKLIFPEMYLERPGLGAMVPILVLLHYHIQNRQTQDVFRVGTQLVRSIPSVARLPYFLSEAQLLIDSIVALFSLTGAVSWPWRLDQKRLWRLILDEKLEQRLRDKRRDHSQIICRRFGEVSPAFDDFEASFADDVMQLDPIIVFQVRDG